MPVPRDESTALLSPSSNAHGIIDDANGGNGDGSREVRLHSDNGSDSHDDDGDTASNDTAGMPSGSTESIDNELNFTVPPLLPLGPEIPLYEPTTFTDITFPDITPWAWLHESLFLSDRLDGGALGGLDRIDSRTDLDANGTSYGSHHLGRDDPRSINSCPLYKTGFDSSNAVRNSVEPQTAVSDKDAEQEGILPNNRSPPSLTRTTGPQYPVPLAQSSTGNLHSGTTKAARQRVVEELVQQASTAEARSREQQARYWPSMSRRVAEAFELTAELSQGDPSSALHTFVELFMSHFSPLWPLLTPQNFDPDSLHPLQFLVLTSIGAMYGGPAANDYGTLTHLLIRERLVKVTDLDGDANDYLWLAQARLLTQVATLYFGQPKAFSYAQTLGALLIAQARRMDLFSAAHQQCTMEQFRRQKGAAPDEERLALWLDLEARKRLAFGIFRGDTFTSVALNTKPLITLEEIDLEMPVCDAVWRGRRIPARAALEMIEHDRTPSGHMRASDIYRICMDQDEMLPPLDPVGHELLLFGLQWPIWRFSHDRDMFERLTGRKTPAVAVDAASGLSDQPPEAPFLDIGSAWSRRRSTVTSETDSLYSTSRRMRHLASERDRLLSALNKWEQALPLVKSLASSDQDRNYILSGLILYHLGHMRLLTPIEELHQIQYRLVNEEHVDGSLVRRAEQWAGSEDARGAVGRVRSTWCLITRESKAAVERLACFNLLAFIALHHGTVLLWSYAGAQDFDDGGYRCLSPAYLGLEAGMQRPEASEMLKSCTELFDVISQARWSSFSKVAKVLGTTEFPRSVTLSM